MMKEWVKKFCLRIWDKIEDHLAKCISGLIIAFLTITLIILRKWLATKHSFEMYGWIWLFLFLAIAGFPIILFYMITWLMKHRRFIKKLKDSRDIDMAIGKWIDDLSTSQKRALFSYANVAKQINVSPNRLKAYLEAVAADHGERLKMGKETFKFVEIRKI